MSRTSRRAPAGATNRARTPGLRRSVAACLLGLALGALCLVALRVDILRTRYALAEALALEQQLLSERRDLTVEMRRLRDPARLATLARKRGFVRPERVIDLELPARTTAQTLAILPDVGARP